MMNRDYTGKNVFVGIDVHKKTYSIANICENEVVKRATIAASPEKLITYLQKYFVGASIYSAYEAGFSGFHLHRYLTAQGVNNIVVHPASIEISARDRVKTDKRDALKIATQLSTGRLRGIHVPSEHREDFRQITRLREKFVNHRKSIGNQIKGLLFQYGLIDGDDKRKVSKQWIKVVLTYKVTKDVHYCLKTLCEQWNGFNEKIKEIEVKLTEQAEEDKAIDSIYQSAPGIGAINARILANELGDMRQFNNSKQICSFMGLTPSEYSSGEHIRRGHISRQGRPIFRKVLIQASWVAIRTDVSLGAIYERLSKTIGGKRAIVAIARRLISWIKSCFRTGELYRVTN